MLQYESMRNELIEYLDALAHGNVPVIDGAIHFFLDDTTLSEDPNATIGLFVYDERELEVLRPVVMALEALAPIESSVLEDHIARRDPDWLRVVDAASTALQLLKARP
jgi:hypothetical protein